MRILIAGIGNIFLGDDGFGVEAIRALLGRELPPEVRVEDFGIRSYDLAYAIMDGPDVTILVDAVPQGEPPGTVCLIEVDMAALEESEPPGAVDAHSMNPVSVLQMVRSLGGDPRRVYVVGCEPEELECDEGRLGLSESVESAIPRAVALIENFVSELLHESTNPKGGESHVLL